MTPAGPSSIPLALGREPGFTVSPITGPPAGGCLNCSGTVHTLYLVSVGGFTGANAALNGTYTLQYSNSCEWTAPAPSPFSVIFLNMGPSVGNIQLLATAGILVVDSASGWDCDAIVLWSVVGNSIAPLDPVTVGVIPF